MLLHYLVKKEGVMTHEVVSKYRDKVVRFFETRPRRLMFLCALYFRVFCEKFGKQKGEKLWWSECFAEIGESLESIADKLTVSATCVMDLASGLPEYPVHGTLKFTQPVTSSLQLVLV